MPWIPQDNHEPYVLQHLSTRMYAGAAELAVERSMTAAAMRGMLVSLRYRGLVSHLPNEGMWRITPAGREAIGA